MELDKRCVCVHLGERGKRLCLVEVYISCSIPKVSQLCYRSEYVGISHPPETPKSVKTPSCPWYRHSINKNTLIPKPSQVNQAQKTLIIFQRCSRHHPALPVWGAASSFAAVRDPSTAHLHGLLPLLEHLGPLLRGDLGLELYSTLLVDFAQVLQLRPHASGEASGDGST